MEVWDIYDEKRNLTGRTCIRGQAMAEGENHLVVEVWVMNDQHQLLVTKRHPNKNNGSLWECTGGAAVAGENSLQAVRRELYEETSLVMKENDFILIEEAIHGEWNTFLDTYVCHTTAEISQMHWQETEVVDGRFVTLEEFEVMIAQGIVVPSVVKRYQMFKERLQRELFGAWEMRGKR